MSIESTTIDVSRLSVLQLIARVHVAQVVPVVLAIAGAGYMAGRFHADIGHGLEVQKNATVVAELRSQNSELQRAERNGPFGDLSKEPWKILDRGNKLTVAGEVDKAIMVYRTVEFYDRIGRDVNTWAAYDMVAKLSASQANSSELAGTERSKWLQRDVAKYKMASEYATQCKKGDCTASQQFWSSCP